jgi:hypothetical protein
MHSSVAMITLLTTSISRSGKPLRAPMPRFHMIRSDAEAVVVYLKSLNASQKGMSLGRMSSDVSVRGGWGAIGIELIFADDLPACQLLEIPDDLTHGHVLA